MSKYKELFNEYIKLKQDIQILASIVQNENTEVTKGQVKEHIKLTSKVCQELKKLESEVYNLYKGTWE